MTDDTDHPTYPNPTVAEAICHVDFDPPTPPTWSVGRPTRFLELTSTEYPNIEGGARIGIAPAFDLSGAVPRAIATPPAFKLQSENKTRYLAVGDMHFAYGQVAPYPGWKSFRKSFLDGWRTFSTLANPSAVLRIDLRYINIIPRMMAASDCPDETVTQHYLGLNYGFGPVDSAEDVIFAIRNYALDKLNGNWHFCFKD